MLTSIALCLSRAEKKKKIVRKSQKKKISNSIYKTEKVA